MKCHCVHCDAGMPSMCMVKQMRVEIDSRNVRRGMLEGITVIEYDRLEDAPAELIELVMRRYVVQS